MSTYRQFKHFLFLFFGFILFIFLIFLSFWAPNLTVGRSRKQAHGKAKKHAHVHERGRDTGGFPVMAWCKKPTACSRFKWPSKVDDGGEITAGSTPQLSLCRFLGPLKTGEWSHTPTTRNLEMSHDPESTLAPGPTILLTLSFSYSTKQVFLIIIILFPRILYNTYILQHWIINMGDFESINLTTTRIFL